VLVLVLNVNLARHLHLLVHACPQQGGGVALLLRRHRDGQRHYALHTLHTLHTLHILYTLYTLYTLHTLHTLHARQLRPQGYGHQTESKRPHGTEDLPSSARVCGQGKEMALGVHFINKQYFDVASNIRYSASKEEGRCQLTDACSSFLAAATFCCNIKRFPKKSSELAETRSLLQ
jgi:hypothetical protein